MIKPALISASTFGRIFEDCLAASQTPEEDLLTVEGYEKAYTFNRRYVNRYKEEIIDFIAELPEKLEEGSSYPELKYDRQGTKWTSFPQYSDYLLALGIDIGKMRCFYLTESSTFPFVQIIHLEEERARLNTRIEDVVRNLKNK